MKAVYTYECRHIIWKCILANQVQNIFKNATSESLLIKI